MSADQCRPVEVDGEVISVRGAEPMDAKDREMFGSVMRAARAKVAADRAAHDAEVWDEGYEAGDADALFDERGLSTDSNAAEHPHANPYRAVTK
ncbi:hypothetical protein [Cryobacterium aureum]|uniref:hypothetical protein n=1 Tax=Cryobacterium aureum TaxID=995037 RepID=UPI000CF5192F|nr:hypothetical protein [Cryobacterium aureum]